MVPVFRKAPPAICCTALPLVARSPVEVAVTPGRGRAERGLGVFGNLLPRRQVLTGSVSEDFPPVVYCTALSLVARPPLDVSLVLGRRLAEGGVGTLRSSLP